MRTTLLLGGPLILFLFALHSNVLTYGEMHPGMVHLSGVNPGGTFVVVEEETYVCEGDSCTLIDTTVEVEEVEGLSFEEETIEYRDGIQKEYNKSKQPGLKKYTDIHIKKPSGFDWRRFQFEFED